MKLSELSKIDVKDLKNIDVNEIKDAFLRDKNTTIIGALVVVSLISCFYIFSTKKKTTTDVSGELTIWEEKITAVDALKTAKDDLEKLKEGFPADLSQNDLIEMVTDFAALNNIDVKSFIPGSLISSKVSSTFTLDLNIAASDYLNLWSFLKNIETSDYNMKIDRLNLTVSSRSGNRGRRRISNQQSQDDLDIIYLADISIKLTNFKR